MKETKPYWYHNTAYLMEPYFVYLDFPNLITLQLLQQPDIVFVFIQNVDFQQFNQGPVLPKIPAKIPVLLHAFQAMSQILRMKQAKVEKSRCK